MSDDLKKYREQIDRIDDELLKLFNQRAGLAQQIGHVKGNGAVLRPEREAQVLQRMVQANNGPLSHQGVIAVVYRGHVAMPRAGSAAARGLSGAARHLQRSGGVPAFRPGDRRHACRIH